MEHCVLLASEKVESPVGELVSPPREVPAEARELDDNLGAVACKEKGRGAADTSAPTGSDRYLVCEVEVTTLLSPK